MQMMVRCRHAPHVVERVLPHEDLVQDHAECVLVGPRRDRPSTDLFGREVRRRSLDHAGLHRVGSGDVLRDAEVREVCVALLVEQDVARFQVAMNHALLVGGVERTAELIQQRGDANQLERSFRNRVREVAAPDEAHHEVGAAGSRQ